MKEADSDDLKIDGNDNGHVDSSLTSSSINPSGIEQEGSAAVPKEEAEADSEETVICNTVAREFIEGDVLPNAITTYQTGCECSSTTLQQNTESTSELITGLPSGSCASCLIHRTPPGICNLNKERFSSDSIAKNIEESTMSIAGNLEASTMTIVNSEQISSISKPSFLSTSSSGAIQTRTTEMKPVKLQQKDIEPRLGLKYVSEMFSRKEK